MLRYLLIYYKIYFFTSIESIPEITFLMNLKERVSNSLSLDRQNVGSIECPKCLLKFSTQDERNEHVNKIVRTVRYINY